MKSEIEQFWEMLDEDGMMPKGLKKSTVPITRNETGFRCSK